jgi:hypothetical protein
VSVEAQSVSEIFCHSERSEESRINSGEFPEIRTN